jgi:hypothetical protein
MGKTRSLTSDAPCVRCHHELDEHNVGGGACLHENCRCRVYQEPRPGRTGNGTIVSSSGYEPCARCEHEFLIHDALTDGHCTHPGCRCRGYRGLRRG